MKKGQRFLVIYKRPTGWYWSLRTAKTYNVGDKIAVGGESYKNKAFCIKMAHSVIAGTKAKVSELKYTIVWEVKDYV